MESVQQNLDPNYVPQEFKTPYDIIELPSQGILYENNKKSVRVEYLTAMDESILTSPNISSGNNMIDILLKRKVKDLGFETADLLIGDRTALIVYLRVTAFGNDYIQLVYDPSQEEFVEATIDLTTLKQKKLVVKPNIKRDPDGVSNKILISLEQQIKSIDGDRDKIKISNIIKRLPILDTRSLRKYINEITPGLEFKTKARTQGGGSIDTFLRFGKNFFWPEL